MRLMRLEDTMGDLNALLKRWRCVSLRLCQEHYKHRSAYYKDTGGDLNAQLKIWCGVSSRLCQDRLITNIEVRITKTQGET